MASTHPEQSADVFQRFILREALLSEGLMDELHMVESIQKVLPDILHATATTLIATVMDGALGAAATGVASKLTKDVITQAFKAPDLLETWREGVLKFNELRHAGTDIPAHSCFKSALGFALAGHYDDALRWVRRGRRRTPDLARAPFIQGLVAGAKGSPAAAVPLLEVALKGRAQSEAKARIQEVLEEARRFCPEAYRVSAAAKP